MEQAHALFSTIRSLNSSNNLAENSMRPIAIGRRNWLHLGSKEAGPKIAAIFSVVESCRRLNIPIRKYLHRRPTRAGQSLHPDHSPDHTNCLRRQPRKTDSLTLPWVVNHGFARMHTKERLRLASLWPSWRGIME